MKGIFAAISSQYSRLDKATYSKPSMLAISHALEDIIITFDLKADLFVSFQQFQFFLVEKDRYLQLEKICAKVFIFVQGIVQEQIQDFHNTVFVEIPPDSQLADEWSIVINHPLHPIILATAESRGHQSFPGDDFRYFKGFLSFDPALVTAGVKQILTNLQTAQLTYQPQPLSDHPETEAEKTVHLKISAFINPLLTEVETKVSELLNKNLVFLESLQENRRISLEMVQRLCYAAEFRDFDANGHLRRISENSAMLFSLLGKSSQDIENIRHASLMHDIGKIGIPDSILLKPGKLTAAEFEIIKQHTVIGSQILQGSPLPLLQMGHEIALCHHEQWDGRGYPHGLEGSAIPLAAQVVALVDVFDALISKRVYKEAFPLEEALGIIRAKRGQHFASRLTDLFLDNIDIFQKG